MERNHRDPAARPQQSLRRHQPAPQLTLFAELVVDPDANRLKGAGRRVDGAPRPARGSRHDAGELSGAANRRAITRPDDGAGDAPRASLLAEAVDDIGKLGLRHGVDKLGGRRSGLRHAHVQRPVVLE